MEIFDYFFNLFIKIEKLTSIFAFYLPFQIIKAYAKGGIEAEREERKLYKKE